MDWVSNSKKFILTFSFKSKQKLLNLLTYNGDDMFEDEEKYNQLIDLISSELNSGKQNDKKSITNHLKSMSKDMHGGVNYIFKLMAVLIKSTDELGLPLVQELSDFCPLATLEDDLTVYKMKFRETVISCVVHIFESNLKIVLSNKSKYIVETNTEKVARLVLCIKQFKRIFLKGLDLFDLVSEVSESEKLLTDEAFMFCYCYGLKSSINAFKTVIDFSNMIVEIINSSEVTSNHIDAILSSIDCVLEDGKKFYQNMHMFQYFLKDNDITDHEILCNEHNHYSKTQLRLLKEKLLFALKDKEQDYIEPRNFKSFTMQDSNEAKGSYLLGDDDNIFMKTVN